MNMKNKQQMQYENFSEYGSTQTEVSYNIVSLKLIIISKVLVPVSLYKGLVFISIHNITTDKIFHYKITAIN